jgi:hypothetical protein
MTDKFAAQRDGLATLGHALNMQTVTGWLKSLDGIQDVQAVKVTINNVTYEGARYTQVGEYTESMDAVRRGDKKAGEKYYNTRLYLLGEVPRKIKGRSRFCFRFPYNNNEWYIGGYYDKKEVTNYHPFGAYFAIHEWTHNEKIDQHEPKQYLRVPMTVEEV